MFDCMLLLFVYVTPPVFRNCGLYRFKQFLYCTYSNSHEFRSGWRYFACPCRCGSRCCRQRWWCRCCPKCLEILITGRTSWVVECCMTEQHLSEEFFCLPWTLSVCLWGWMERRKSIQALLTRCDNPVAQKKISIQTFSVQVRMVSRVDFFFSFVCTAL